MDFKSVFEKVQGEGTFIKTAAKVVLDGGQKAVLNRKGNTLFNSGDIEGARRIFLSTGYTGGLVRVGDYYNQNGRPLDALRMYWVAPDRKKAEPIIARLSAVIQSMIRNEGS
ncbi:MAG: hypothetical protein LBG93_01415 [Treponema sp.]|jgi:hypothetical protein|nr:hypothetical protein [Treponema sp.]